jgi:hypothetical protein
MILTLVGIGVEAVAAYVVLGLPDLPAAAEFLTGNVPAMAGSLATAQVVLWLALSVAFCGILVSVLLKTVATLGAAGHSPGWSLMVVVIGLIILAAGLHHRSGAASVSLSGGSLQEARAQLAR